MREPRIENKYNLTPPGIKDLVVLDRSKVCAPLFWRNNVINAWCITRTAGTKSDFALGYETDFWLGINDEKDEIKSNFSSFGGMCNYNPTKFYDEKEIENKNDLEIQEKALEIINRLIDEGILGFAEKETVMNKDIKFEADMLEGNINRMFITNDLDELRSMHDFAMKRVEAIYAGNLSRVLEANKDKKESE